MCLRLLSSAADVAPRRTGPCLAGVVQHGDAAGGVEAAVSLLLGLIDRAEALSAQAWHQAAAYVPGGRRIPSVHPSA